MLPGERKVCGRQSGRQCIELRRTVTVVPLSPQWRFKTDPVDEGVKGEWFVPDLDDSGWAAVRSDKDCGWECQGFAGYTAYAWYRAELPNLPGRLRAFMYLNFGSVDEQAWVYLNGTPICEHTAASTGRSINQIWDKPFSVNVSEHLRPEGPKGMGFRLDSAVGTLSWCPSRPPTDPGKGQMGNPG